MKLWIVGQWKGEKYWEFQGVFDTEKNALSACINENHFIGPAHLNESRPDNTTIWEGAYYPLRGKD